MATLAAAHRTVVGGGQYASPRSVPWGLEHTVWAVTLSLGFYTLGNPFQTGQSVPGVYTRKKLEATMRGNVAQGTDQHGRTVVP
jgi:hypothetical protein